MHARDELLHMSAALDQLLQGHIGLPAFVAQCRSQTQLAAALPPRFNEVLQGLLDRLESSALFAEESCSFSQKDLIDSLKLWLDKARDRLPA